VNNKSNGSLVLSTDQETAYHKIISFILDDAEQAFILKGYSGTGKSRLVEYLLSQLDNVMKTAQLLNPDTRKYSLQLTATTNKAAENLMEITNHEVRTIHSALGLMVQRFEGSKTKLVARNSSFKLKNTLLIIDEASYIDSNLATLIFRHTENCKILLIGDPAQLTNMGTDAPIFRAPFPSVQLSQVMRQAEGNPIIELATQFRNTVYTGRFFSFKPDGQIIRHLSREDWNHSIEQEFNRPDWHYKESKILTWRNKTTIEYNNWINGFRTGNSEIQVGDYVTCNNYIQLSAGSIKTDQMVRVTSKIEDRELGLDGYIYGLDNRYYAFMPTNYMEKKKLLKHFYKHNDDHSARIIEDIWIDLRPVYAQTINKSQGSTYGKVFIDLDDVMACPGGNLLARLLYVGVSRAKYAVDMVGDLV